jgi:hypothetical protein
MYGVKPCSQSLLSRNIEVLPEEWLLLSPPVTFLRQRLAAFEFVNPEIEPHVLNAYDNAYKLPIFEAAVRLTILTAGFVRPALLKLRIV